MVCLQQLGHQNLGTTFCLGSRSARPTLSMNLDGHMISMHMSTCKMLCRIKAGVSYLTYVVRSSFCRYVMCALAWLLWHIVASSVIESRLLAFCPDSGIWRCRLLKEFELDDDHESSIYIALLTWFTFVDACVYLCHFLSIRICYPVAVTRCLGLDRVPPIKAFTSFDSENFGEVQVQLLKGQQEIFKPTISPM